MNTPAHLSQTRFTSFFKILAVAFMLTLISCIANAQANNARLSLLHLSSGQIMPSFVATNRNYTATVANSVSSITVTPTAIEAASTITVNGMPVISKAISPAIPLNVGANTITTMVTAPDGISTKAYITTVTRQPSTTAGLASLVLSAGQLSPGFTTANTNYSTTVALVTSAIKVTVTPVESHETIKVNGVLVASGTPSQSITLAPGVNTITINTTAQDGITSKNYTVAITRSSLTGNANLSVLHLSMGQISPLFNPAVTNYTDTVNNQVSSITVRPVSSNSQSTIKVNGVAVVSGAASQAIPLIVGANTITTVVTAPDGVTTKAYTATIVRLVAYSTKLRYIAASFGYSLIFDPFEFNNDKANYFYHVPYAVTSMKIQTRPDDLNATVKVNGQLVDASGNSNAIPLIVGATPINIVVTAVDGRTKTYTIQITREQPLANATVLNIKASNFILLRGANGSLYSEKGFAYNVPTYSATLTNSNSSTIITVTPDYASNATVTVNNIPATIVVPVSNPNFPELATPPIPLTVGQNTLTVITTAQDGVTKTTYTIIITRQPANNADLLKFSFRQGAINVSPAFSPTVYDYTARVTDGSSYIGELSYTLSDVAAQIAITINGTQYTGQDLPLNPGPNYVVIVVTAEDGVTKKTYKVTLTSASGSFAANATDNLYSQPAVLSVKPYPNPFKNTININTGEKEIGKTTVEISNVNSWRVLYKSEYTNQNGVIQLNVANLESGIYLLRLTRDDKQTVFKIIK